MFERQIIETQQLINELRGWLESIERAIEMARFLNSGGGGAENG